MDFNYISLGYDCSTAGVLKGLGLRECAYPFDWTEVNFDSLKRCINDNFKQFHKQIILNKSKQRAIDFYGIQFPHDYPIIQQPGYIDNNFYSECKICDDYEKYTDQILEKYGRRIERFQNTLNDTNKPLIVLYRETYQHAVAIKYILENKYKRENIIIIVGTAQSIEEQGPKNHAVIACNPEINGDWNDNEIWRKAIERAKQIYPQLLIRPTMVQNRFSMKFW
jgi:hypothetical protein